MDAVMEFLFQFTPRVNLCIAFAVIPTALMLVVGFTGEAIRAMRENKKRRRRWSR